MDDARPIPPDVLAVFVEIERLVDATVGAERCRTPRDSATGTVTFTGHVAGVAPPAAAAAAYGGLPAMTVGSVGRARAWLHTRKVALGVGGVTGGGRDRGGEQARRRDARRAGGVAASRRAAGRHRLSSH